eukprot:GEMP01061842.1.p1 GENE.GEMP01061842.1~~GEMP01061842.1.p1  ORF type:complete len:370 (+),score=73.26 GEMP01061842.1:157-1266(+)
MAFLFFAVATVGSAAACLQKSTLGRTEVPCAMDSQVSGITLHYGYMNNAVSLCVVNTIDDKWVGVGVGTMMRGATVIVSSNDGSSNDGVKVWKLTGYVKPSTEVSDFGQTAVKSEVANDGKRMLCYTIPMAKINGKLNEANFVYALGNRNTFSQHSFGMAKHTAIDLVSGRSLEPKTPSMALLITHVVFMMTAYLALYPIAVIIAVYAAPGFSAGAKFFLGHRVVMIAAVVFTICGLVAVLIHTDGLVNDTHGIVGLITVVLCLQQPINAHFRVKKDHKNRRFWEYLHKGTGRLALLMGFVTCILGGVLFNKRHKNVAPLVIILILLIVSLLLWIALRVRQALAAKAKKDDSTNIDVETSPPVETSAPA